MDAVAGPFTAFWPRTSSSSANCASSARRGKKRRTVAPGKRRSRRALRTLFLLSVTHRCTSLSRPWSSCKCWNRSPPRAFALDSFCFPARKQVSVPRSLRRHRSLWHPLCANDTLDLISAFSRRIARAAWTLRPSPDQSASRHPCSVIAP